MSALPATTPVTRAEAIALSRRIDAATGIAARRIAVMVSTNETLAMAAAVHELDDIAQAAAEMLVAVSRHQIATRADDDDVTEEASDALIVAEDQLAVLLADAGYIALGADADTSGGAS